MVGLDEAFNFCLSIDVVLRPLSALALFLPGISRNRVLWRGHTAILVGILWLILQQERCGGAFSIARSVFDVRFVLMPYGDWQTPVAAVSGGGFGVGTTAVLLYGGASGKYFPFFSR